MQITNASKETTAFARRRSEQATLHNEIYADKVF